MPESERERHIRHWIRSARKRLARGETYDHGTDTELGCEDAQQCVEHALKAVITAAGGNPKQTHNIPHLIDQARETGERTPAAVRRTVTLTQFAGADRYELITGNEPPPDKAEYDAAMKDARATLEWAEERVRVLVPGIGLDAPAHATHRRTR